MIIVYETYKYSILGIDVISYIYNIYIYIEMEIHVHCNYLLIYSSKLRE